MNLDVADAAIMAKVANEHDLEFHQPPAVSPQTASTHIEEQEDQHRRQRRMQAFARRLSIDRQLEAGDLVTSGPLQMSSPHVQIATMSYSSALASFNSAEARRMSSKLATEVAPKMSATERRKLASHMIRVKRRCKPKQKIVLIQSYEEAQALAKLPKSWNVLSPLKCQGCGCPEVECRNGQLEKLDPCGHRALCHRCVRATMTCPICHESIDHLGRDLLRPLTSDWNKVQQLNADVDGVRSQHVTEFRRAAYRRIRDARSRGAEVHQLQQAYKEKRRATEVSRHYEHLEEVKKAMQEESTMELKAHKPLPQKSSKLQRLEQNVFVEDQSAIQDFRQAVSILRDSGAASPEAIANAVEKMDELARLSVDDVAAAQESMLSLMSDLPRHACSEPDGTAAVLPAPRFWIYEISQGWNGEQLPYSMLDPISELARYRGRVLPSIQELERQQLQKERDAVASYAQSCRDGVVVAQERPFMLREDHISHIERAWQQDDRYSVEKPDMLDIKAHFKSLAQSLKSELEGWTERLDKLTAEAAATRRDRYAQDVVAAQHVHALVVQYRAMCRLRGVAPGRRVEELLMSQSDSISVQELNAEHLEVISTLIRRCHQHGRLIRRISVERSRFSAAAVASWSMSLMQVETVHEINFCRCQARPGVFGPLVATNVASLVLAHNKIGCSRNLTNALLQLSPMGRLRRLNLSHNSLGIDTARALAKCLEHHLCPLEHVDVSWNSMGTNGVAAILNALRTTSATRITFLDLSWNGFREGTFDATVPSGVKLRCIGNAPLADTPFPYIPPPPKPRPTKKPKKKPKKPGRGSSRRRRR